MSHATVTLTGTYEGLGGAPDRGKVYIRATSDPIFDTGVLVLSGLTEIDLDIAGHFSVALPATDDAGLSPTGFGYKFWTRLESSGNSPYVFFDLPTSDGPTVDITAKTPSDPATFMPGVTYATEAEIVALQAQIDALGTGSGGGTGGGGSSTSLLPYFFPTDHGAVGDGVADDTTALQATIDAANAAGGGMVALWGPVGQRRFKITGPITVKTAVGLQGFTNNDEGTAHSSTILCSGSSAQVKFGDWATGHSRIAACRDFTIDGNHAGNTAGIAYLQCVGTTFENITIEFAAGRGLTLDAAQNIAFISVDTTSCGTANVCLINGSGGLLFLRCENTPGTASTAMGLLITDPNGTTGNAYPYGSAHINFVHCIFELYGSGAAALCKLEAGSVRFTYCGFSNNDVTMTADALVSLADTSFPGIPTTAVFDGCTFNGGTAKSEAIRIIGNNRVVITGDSYFQQHTTMFVQEGGTGVLAWDGTNLYGANIDAKIAAVSGGAVFAWQIEREQGVRYTIPDGTQVPFIVRRASDAGHRFQIDRDGGLQWMDGTAFTPLQNISYDDTNDHLVATTMVVSGRFQRVPNVPGGAVYPTGAVTIDSKASSVHKFILTGTGTISSMAVTNPGDGAVLTVMIARDAAQTIAWASDMRFNGGAAPAAPATTDWLSVTFLYEAATAKWIEQYRSNVPFA